MCITGRISLHTLLHSVTLLFYVSDLHYHYALFYFTCSYSLNIGEKLKGIYFGTAILLGAISYCSLASEQQF